MAKILVAGALAAYDQPAQEFIQRLGEEIIEHGHTLLSGCRNEFDAMIAAAAFHALKKEGHDPGKRLISYVVDGCHPVHQFGTILKSRLSSWDLTFKRLYVPEPIHQADVVIIVGGLEGTLCAANWARIDKKPLLPVTIFGGAAEEVYNEEIKEFYEKYSENMDKFQYEILNQISYDCKKIAGDVISLASRIISSSRVFVAMSFSEEPKLADAFESFKDVCKERGYDCDLVKDLPAVDRILPEIIARIRKSAFIIVDLSEERANVYYELGFAQALRKEVIVTAFKGTPLPFDVKDIPVIFWEGQKQLKDELRKRINVIATAHGR